MAYQYDANGNRVDDGTHTYTFDASNRLTTVDGGNMAAATTHLSNGRRRRP